MEPTLTNGRAEDAREARVQIAPDAALTERLDRIEREVLEQGSSARTVQRGFALFAFMALLIAIASLIAVATKLDGKGTTVINRTVAVGGTPAAAAPAPLAHKVSVGLKEFAISPSPSQAAAGKVTFNLHNAGQVKHEFVVVRTDKPAGSLLKGAEADETGNVGEVGNLPPGSTKKLTLNLKAGHYALICNLPGHYKAGQHADFNVR
jgi:uncharacterized cupredoxin-like copper-binding protein